jgi:hypothetical protein
MTRRQYTHILSDVGQSSRAACTAYARNCTLINDAESSRQIVPLHSSDISQDLVRTSDK